MGVDLGILQGAACPVRSRHVDHSRNHRTGNARAAEDVPTGIPVDRNTRVGVRDRRDVVIAAMDTIGQTGLEGWDGLVGAWAATTTAPRRLVGASSIGV